MRPRISRVERNVTDSFHEGREISLKFAGKEMLKFFENRHIKKLEGFSLKSNILLKICSYRTGK